MQNLFEYYFNTLESYHDELKSTIEGLSQSEIDAAKQIHFRGGSKCLPHE